MKFLGLNRVLCLSPHPDDVEFSMSGTVLKHVDTVFDILCLTQGGDCDTTTSLSRIQEVKNFWQHSNTNNYNLYFSPYKLLKELDLDQWINWLESNYISKNNYDGIITPSNKDSHFEHKIVCEMGYPLARVSKFSLIEYYSPSTLEYWIPNVYVDISEYYKQKLKMLNEFKSQSNKSYFKEDSVLGFHTNYKCAKRDLNIVEQFNLKQTFL